MHQFTIVRRYHTSCTTAVDRRICDKNLIADAKSDKLFAAFQGFELVVFEFLFIC